MNILEVREDDDRVFLRINMDPQKGSYEYDPWLGSQGSGPCRM